VRREERPFEGWYYRQDGEPFGPVPTGRLKGLLAAGRLLPRQAVWQRSGHDLLFVHAATAASGTRAEGSQPSPSGPGLA
jgi:GYF domain 2